MACDERGDEMPLSVRVVAELVHGESPPVRKEEVTKQDWTKFGQKLTAAEGSPAKYGGLLGQLVFCGEVDRLFAEALSRAAEADPLRVQLEVEASKLLRGLAGNGCGACLGLGGTVGLPVSERACGILAVSAVG